jgi:exodeoxyribonuclease VII small subunit
MSAAKAKKSDTQVPASYDEAMTELEAIIAEVEDPSAPIDRLAPLVERGAYLVGWCRTTLGQTQSRVNQALARLESGADAHAASGEEDDTF